MLKNCLAQEKWEVPQNQKEISRTYTHCVFDYCSILFKSMEIMISEMQSIN